MTAKEALPIIQAIIAGDTIQFLDAPEGLWKDMDEPPDIGLRFPQSPTLYAADTFRVKPKPRQWFAVIWEKQSKLIPVLFETRTEAEKQIANYSPGDIVLVEEKL